MVLALIVCLGVGFRVAVVVVVVVVVCILCGMEGGMRLGWCLGVNHHPRASARNATHAAVVSGVVCFFGCIAGWAAAHGPAFGN